MNILITGTGGPAGQALLNQFMQPRYAEHKILGVDLRPVAHPALWASETVPAASDPTMIDHLVDLVEKYSIDLIIPTVQEELTAVAEATAEGRFYPARVLIGEPDGVADSCDKYRTMLRLEHSSVPVPRHTCPGHHRSPESLAVAVGECAIIKPRAGRGSRGVHRILPNQMSQDDWHRLDEHSIVQEYAPGDEYSPMVHLSRYGEPPVVVMMQKITDSNHRTVSVRRVPTEAFPDIARLAVHAAEALNLTGPVDIDFRRLEDNRPAILEVNARFGSHSLHAPEILDSALREVSREHQKDWGFL